MVLKVSAIKTAAQLSIMSTDSSAVFPGFENKTHGVYFSETDSYTECIICQVYGCCFYLEGLLYSMCFNIKAPLALREVLVLVSNPGRRSLRWSRG